MDWINYLVRSIIVILVILNPIIVFTVRFLTTILICQSRLQYKENLIMLNSIYYCVPVPDLELAIIRVKKAPETKLVNLVRRTKTHIETVTYELITSLDSYWGLQSIQMVFLVDSRL